MKWSKQVFAVTAAVTVDADTEEEAWRAALQVLAIAHCHGKVLKVKQLR